MRWLVGWSSTAAGPVRFGTAGSTGPDGETVHPVGSQLLWGDPDPLWAVGDWRPDEVRIVTADEQTRIAVLGTCGATDEQLRVGLFAARGVPCATSPPGPAATPPSSRSADAS